MIVIRPAGEPDWHFIKSSWMRSYWESGDAPKVDYKTYWEEFGRIVDRLLPKAEVATFESAPTEILGYVVRDRDWNIVHWVYVKQPYRRQEIATTLLVGVEEFTISTRAGRKLNQRLNLKFNPWALQGKR